MCVKNLSAKKAAINSGLLMWRLYHSFLYLRNRKVCGFLRKFGFPSFSLAPPSMDDNLSSSGDILRLGLFTILSKQILSQREGKKRDRVVGESHKALICNRDILTSAEFVK
jgi:hypothetical protein